MAKVVHAFFDADLRMGHDGLTDQASSAFQRADKLQPGELLVFINRSRNKMKVLTAYNVLGYLRLKEGKIDLRTLPLVVRAFNPKTMLDIPVSLRKELEPKRRPTVMEIGKAS